MIRLLLGCAAILRRMDYVSWIRSKVGQEMIFLNVANAIISNDKGEVLFQRRGGHSEEAWATPGGAMELGESAVDALKREILEETGLQIEIEGLVGIYTRNTQAVYPNGDTCQMVLHSFACRPTGGELKVDNKETLELRWVDPKSPNCPKLFRDHLQRALNDFVAGKRAVID